MNLERLLEMTLPPPKPLNEMNVEEEYKTECGICYSYRLDNKHPELLCSNGPCSQPFHQTCLYEVCRILVSRKHFLYIVPFSGSGQIQRRDKALGPCLECVHIVIK
jgi:E3 ubiquitin-protein ligase FANCL